VSPRSLVRVLRYALLGGSIVAVALFLRRTPRYRIPDADQSLAPRFPGGTVVVGEPLDEDDPVPRGSDVVYEEKRDGVAYARFGRVFAIPGDRVDATGGEIRVNGVATGLRGAITGEVPEGAVLVLAPNPGETRYPDSRAEGFVARARLRAIIRSSIAMDGP